MTWPESYPKPTIRRLDIGRKGIELTFEPDDVRKAVVEQRFWGREANADASVLWEEAMLRLMGPFKHAL